MAAVEGLPHRSSLEGSSDVGHPMPQGQPPPVRKFFRRLSLMVTAPQLQDGAPVPDCEILSTPKASDGLGIPPALPSRPSARRSASLDIGSTEHQLNFHPSDGLVKQCPRLFEAVWPCTRGLLKLQMLLRLLLCCSKSLPPIASEISHHNASLKLPQQPPF
eukprot:GHVS01011457.1.p2 GENE.GHVS01011457.1~~GHVS01011457.1.p2  ORF type:complete len:161 (+),score=24.60 GHVS01011457.1:123-605(+)